MLRQEKSLSPKKKKKDKQTNKQTNKQTQTQTQTQTNKTKQNKTRRIMFTHNIDHKNMPDLYLDRQL